ncbi:MAG: NDP-sugar synthase, partial [Caldilinea sp.]
MKAVVMAGGEGSRLRPLTIGRPKPMVPIVNKAVISHIFDLLKHHGITEVVVTLRYMASAIEDFYDDGSSIGMKITYVVEEAPLGTAGSVKNAAQYLDDTFIVISGDAL